MKSIAVLAVILIVVFLPACATTPSQVVTELQKVNAVLEEQAATIAVSLAEEKAEPGADQEKIAKLEAELAQVQGHLARVGGSLASAEAKGADLSWPELIATGLGSVITALAAVGVWRGPVTARKGAPPTKPA